MERVLPLKMIYLNFLKIYINLKYLYLLKNNFILKGIFYKKNPYKKIKN
jgi:hypothetical protein